MTESVQVEQFGVSHVVEAQDGKYNVYCYGFHQKTCDTHAGAVKLAKSMDTRENGYEYH